MLFGRRLACCEAGPKTLSKLNLWLPAGLDPLVNANSRLWPAMSPAHQTAHAQSENHAAGLWHRVQTSLERTMMPQLCSTRAAINFAEAHSSCYSLFSKGGLLWSQALSWALCLCSREDGAMARVCSDALNIQKTEVFDSGNLCQRLM